MDSLARSWSVHARGSFMFRRNLIVRIAIVAVMTFKVTVTLPATDLALRWGMTAAVTK
jgi:hypothetical protein